MPVVCDLMPLSSKKSSSNNGNGRIFAERSSFNRFLKWAILGLCLFYYFRSWKSMFFIKKILMTAWTFVSGSSGIEATALPTAPRPLPYSKGVMRLICTEIIKRNTKKNV